jgi:hypothetical protein
MTVQQIAAGRYRRMAKLARHTAAEVMKLWRRVNPDRLDLTWVAPATDALRIIAAAQLTAAGEADMYVTATLLSQHIDPAAAGKVVPQAFAGIASDGRSLLDLLGEAPIVAKATITRGGDTDRAMAAGAVWLDMAVRTQVADAGRAAEGTAIAARAAVSGYVRMLEPPSCSRCVILAGTWYRWNAGFERHPRCDCRHIPAAEDTAGAQTTDPRRYFDSLSADEQDRAFTRAGAQAIRDGADLAQVVNARRGMKTAGGRLITTESTTRHGRAVRGRPMPEQIYRDAGGDRDEAIRLLKQHGYLT